MSQGGLIAVTDAIIPSDVPTSFPTNSGTAVPSSNVLNVLGAGAATTSGSGNTITITVATGGGLTLGAFGSTPNADGLSLTSGVLNMQPASGSEPGGVSTTTQTFAGAKTFGTSVSSPEYLVTGSGSGTISILPQAAAGTYNFNLPITAGTSGYFLTSAGGASSPMTWTSISGSGAITTITGNSGGAESPSSGNFTFSGGTTGLTFAGTAATETLTGTLVLANGGTSASLTASNGGIFYSTASAGAILSGTATALQMLQSGSSTAPAWSTSTWPATTTVNQLLYSSSSNVVGGITASANGVLISSNSNVPSWLANSGTAGWVLTANSGAPPSWQAPASTSISLTGDTGGALTGAAFTIKAGTSSQTSGSSVSIAGSGTTLTLNVSDSNNNTIIGEAAGNATLSGTYNTSLGNSSLTSLTSGIGNTCIGRDSGYFITSGSYNSLLGYDTQQASAFTGSYNVGVGYQASISYAAAESSNILLNNPGTASESNALHIGNGTGTGNQQLSSAFISGINGVTVSNTKIVTINSFTDQLGVVTTVPIANGGTNAASFTQSNGIVAYNGTSLVNYAGPQLSSAGIMTNTAQPAFLAYLATTTETVTGDGTAFTVILDTKSFDDGSNYNLATGVFTAPVTGKYLFNIVMAIVVGATVPTAVIITLVTTSHTYNIIGSNSVVIDPTTNTNATRSATLIVPMTAADTCSLVYQINGNAKTSKLAGENSATLATYFSGYLVC